jgi:hypothetical protein
VNTKTMVTLSLLVGIGAVLHTVMPGIVFGMKPDLMLIMMFLGIFLFPDLKSTVLLGSVTGVISGLTTTFPGGLIPNVIDKFFTALLIYAIFRMVQKLGKTFAFSLVLTFIGTLVSGMLFLGSAYLIVGLPGPFLALAAGVVLPATVVNTVVMALIQPIASGILKRSNIAVN